MVTLHTSTRGGCPLFAAGGRPLDLWRHTRAHRDWIEETPSSSETEDEPQPLGVLLERPTYDLTVFKVHFGKLTLKIYTKGERVLRVEAVAHNVRAQPCGRSLLNFTVIVRLLTGMVDRFFNTLQSLDTRFLSDDQLEQLSQPSHVGKTRVGGIDFNRPRMRRVAEALLARVASPHGFTASQLALKVCYLGSESQSPYGPRCAAYDLKKFRARAMVPKIDSRRRYEVVPPSLPAQAALVVLSGEVVTPLLAAGCHPPRGRKPKTLPRSIATTMPCGGRCWTYSTQ